MSCGGRRDGEIEFVVRYDRETILAANHRFLMRSIGTRLRVAFGISFVLFVMLLAMGDRGWIVGSYGAVLVLGVGFWYAVRRAYIDRGLKRLAMMKDSRVTVSMGDSAIAMRSELGFAEVPWSQFQRVWKYPDLWMLFYDTNGFVTLPTRDLPSDAAELIEEKVRAMGGKVE